MEKFSDCEVHSQLFQNLEFLHYSCPTPVQQYAIPISLLRRDLMACAQTGSGKTGAYLYPTIAKMLNDGPPPVFAAGQCLPITLILCPTRELAMQIQDEVLKFTFRTGIKSLVICGGKSIIQQESDALQGCDIIIATPGRLIDFIERKVVNLAIVRYLIMDEADKLLDMGFEQQVIRVLTAIKKRDRETTLCSATFPNKVKQIADKYLRDHVLLSVGKTGSTSESIRQILHLVRKNDKPELLIKLLEAGGRTLGKS
jgi:ATP-dependent RNA helicase DDX3X